jgi:hypothetical protein
MMANDPKYRRRRVPRERALDASIRGVSDGLEDPRGPELARIEIAIQSVNPDPAQTIQAYRDQRDAQQRAADQLVIATQALVATTRRLTTATWALVGLTFIMAAAQLAPLFMRGGR